MYRDCELPHSRHLYRCFPAFVLPSFTILLLQTKTNIGAHNPPTKIRNFFSNLDGFTCLYAVIFTHFCPITHKLKNKSSPPMGRILLEQFSFLFVAPYECMDGVYTSNTILAPAASIHMINTYVRPKFW